jgi:hypothetical protein
MWLNLTSGASFASGGEARVRINSTDGGAYFQQIDLLKLDYSFSYASYQLPFDTYRTYTITVSDEVTGEPRSYADLILFHNGTNVIFEGMSSPAYVRADADGVYDLVVKSSTAGGEVFSLCVGLGHIAAERVIVQTT